MLWCLICWRGFLAPNAKQFFFFLPNFDFVVWVKNKNIYHAVHPPPPDNSPTVKLFIISQLALDYYGGSLMNVFTHCARVNYIDCFCLQASDNSSVHPVNVIEIHGEVLPLEHPNIHQSPVYSRPIQSLEPPIHQDTASLVAGS